MKTLLSSLFLLLISTIQVFWDTTTITTSDSQENELESQITPESNQEKIIKLQTFFKELNLYTWNIDWNYESIEKSLIDYQIKAWVITDKDDWWAGYFGKKTINALKEEFEDEFEKAADILRMELPSEWLTSFIVTAYYSPVPGQRRYTTWSYYWDVILNWEGHTTASGKPVFSGLLAAPRNYKYWTKIYLEGIWVWAVEDRGWAIVNAWERWHSYDRIDMWMWYGDEWLDRALKWGKREVKWEIIWSDEEVTVEFEKSPIYNYDKLRAYPDSSWEVISKLQQLLLELELYSWEIDWNYQSVKPDLVQFQLDNKVISSKYDYDAWFFWPKTMAAIRHKYIKNIFVAKYRDTDKKNDYWLTLVKRVRLEKIANRIDKYFVTKTYWDDEKVNKYKLKLKSKLDILIENQKDLVKKSELKYLKEII